MGEIEKSHLRTLTPNFLETIQRQTGVSVIVSLGVEGQPRYSWMRYLFSIE